MIALFLACTGPESPFESGVGDTGLADCGRIEGTTGILLYQERGTTVSYPQESPDGTSRTTSVAGPLGDGGTFASVTDGRIGITSDGGCAWDDAGTLPASGDWALVAAGTRIYAFDRGSGAGARSDDLGVNWTTFDAGEAFASPPVVDAEDTNRLRGVSSRGVLTSSDGGDTWPVSGGLPDELSQPASASLLASDLEQVLVGGAGGAWRSQNGGQSWDAAYAGGDAASVAVHPDSADVFFIHAADTDGVMAIWRSGDAGADWDRLVDDVGIEMGATMPLWPLPGDTTTAVSGYGPATNNEGNLTVALYTVSTTGTHTLRLGDWYAMHDLAFASDRWLAAVDAIAP